MSRQGRFITFEGIDGAGKSSHIAAVRDWLLARGAQVRETREPGGTPLGEAVRELFLKFPMNPHSEALLVFAARREHLQQVVWPALLRGEWVVCDRFTDATFAYQGGGRQLGEAVVSQLAEWTHPGFAPDLTLVFDLPPAAAQDRIQSRAAPDRIEAEAESFHERVRQAYLDRAAAEPQRVSVFDSSQAKTVVAEQVLARVAQLWQQYQGSAA